MFRDLPKGRIIYFIIDLPKGRIIYFIIDLPKGRIIYFIIVEVAFLIKIKMKINKFTKITKIIKTHLYFLLSLLVLLLLVLMFMKRTNIERFEEKPKIWCYWETLPGKKKPGYIDLCYDSIVHNCGKCFDIIQLNESTIKRYLPDIDMEKIAHLSIPHKTDYYRYALLEKYGGVWVDADIIITRCLCPLYQKLMKSDKDYMGFGCGRSRQSCHANPNGKYDPTNWLMMSKPKTRFMKCVKDHASEVINRKTEFEYHEIGKVGLKKCISQMGKDWDYLHLPSTCQEYDHEGNKLNNIMKPYDVKKCSKERYFFPLYNTAPGYPDWFKELSKEELLSNSHEGKYYLKDILQEAFSKKRSC